MTKHEVRWLGTREEEFEGSHGRSSSMVYEQYECSCGKIFEFCNGWGQEGSNVYRRIVFIEHALEHNNILTVDRTRLT